MPRAVPCCLLLAVLLLASASATAADARTKPRSAPERQAAKSYEVFRRARQVTDEVPRPSSWKVDRKRIIASRRIAEGELPTLPRAARRLRAGRWEAHLVLLRGMRNAALVLHHGRDAVVTTGRLADFVRTGAAVGVAGCDGWTTVVLVRDGATLAERTGGGVSVQVPVEGNAIVDRSGPGGTISWSYDGRRRSLPVNRGALPECPKPDTPVRARILEGSAVLLDRGDGSAPLAVPLDGELQGRIPGGFDLGQDNTLELPAGTLIAGAVEGCPRAVFGVDAARPASVTITARGDVSLTMPGTPPDVRPGRCGATLPGPLVATGRITPDTGLSRIVLTSAPFPLDGGGTITYSLHVAFPMG